MARNLSPQEGLSLWSAESDCQSRRSMAGLRLDDDLHVTIENRHEFQQPSQGVLRQMAMQQRRQIGLPNPQELRRCELRQSAALDDFAQLLYQISPQLHLFRIIEAEIGKNIAASRMDGNLPAHDRSSFRADPLHRLQRCHETNIDNCL